MATFPGFTNPGIPTDKNPSHFAPFGNVGAPYMATLSLLGLTVGLLVWLFSTSLVPTVSTASQSVPPPEQHHVDSKVDLSPSSPVSTSSSSTSPGESLDSSNQVAKKKKKKTKKKKKSPKGEAKSAATALSSTQVEPPSSPPQKVKFPCRLCKDDHLLHDCPSIPRVLDVWSHDPAHSSSSSEAHGDTTLSVGNGKKKGEIRIPCKLCEGHHPLHLCLLMDKASVVLESLTASPPQLPEGYQHLSATADSPPVDEEIALNSSLFQPPLPEPGCAKPIPDQPLVRKNVDSGSPPIDHSVSKEHNSHVLLISSDSPESGNDSPIPATLKRLVSVPLEQRGNHMIPPPSSLVASFDWSRLTTYRLPSHVPFWVTVHNYNTSIPGTLLDEGASVSLMPATTWQALGSPQLVPAAPNLTAFDRGTSQPLGILPKFPITLGGKTVYIDVSVTQGPLNFSLLLGRDYVYAMGALVSSLFRVACFPHDGRIMTIDQLAFVHPQAPPTQSSSPPSFHPPVASAPSQINYVATYPVQGSSDAAVVHSVLGALGPDFQDIGLPSGMALLEAPTSYSLG